MCRLCLKFFIFSSDLFVKLCYNNIIREVRKPHKKRRKEIKMGHIANLESVMVQITRGTLCDILIALTAVQQAAPEAKERGWR